MKKERLRDWPIHCTNFRVEAVAIPDELWAVAKEQQNLWNQMVETHEELLKNIEGLEKEARKPFFTGFSDKIKRLAGESPLKYHRKWLVLEKFQKTVQAYWGKKGGAPKKQKGLRKINLPLVFKDGGHPSEWLFARRESRCIQMEAAAGPNPFNGPTYGHFLVESEFFEFKAHAYPLPAGAILKRFNLCGRLVRPFGWEWSLKITMEVPHETRLGHGFIQPTNRTAAIDLGWRNMGGYIRLGVLADNAGNMLELRLPDLTDSERKKQIKYFAAKGIESPGTNLADKIKFQAKQDALLEKCKGDLKSRFDEIPSAIRPASQSWHLVRHTGLFRLLRQIKDHEIENELTLPIREILETWETHNRRYHRLLTSIEQERLKKLDTVYKQIAAWLAESYDTLIWEGDLALSDLAQDDSSIPAKEAQKYRHWVSLHLLRTAIKNAFSKYKRELVNEKAAGTSSTCYRCKGMIESSPKLVVTCENGHRHDQDQNSALLMLGTKPKGSGKITIFDCLKKFVAPIEAVTETRAGSRHQ